MQAPLLPELARRNRHNLRTLRSSPAAEISGALGDLGTLLPLMIALALQGSINLSSTLVFSGLFNIVTGAVFGIPLPVQPMKAIASSAISTPLSLSVTTASGALVSLAVLLLSATGLLRLLTRLLPVPIIKGIQLGAGLRLVISGASLILPLSWLTPALDSRLSTLVAFLLLFLTQRYRRFPYALLIFLLGLLTSLLIPPSPVLHYTNNNNDNNNDPGTTTTPPWKPSLSHLPVLLPDFQSFSAWSTALSQLPLTTLNSVLAVSALSSDLLPDLPAPGATSLGLSVAAMNLAGCWFGAMPVCHGAGGLAAQHRFGARSGASVVLLGVVKMVLGLGFAGGPDGSLMGLLRRFPRGVLGVMVVAAGLELAKVGSGLNTGGAGDLWEECQGASDESGGGAGVVRKCREVGEREQQERWMVMMVTAAGIVAFKNDAVGFAAGCCCHGAYRVADWIERRREGRWGFGERRPLLW
ncbi:hypothetical protein VTI74DRAFT_9632 [Chaetomium olivicolor]